MKKNNIIIISGPTATGKTSTSIGLAKLFNGEIINFDSLLFYKELNIGSAKPTLSEQDHIVHRMVGTHSIFNPINAADYIKIAIPLINDCHERNKNVFLVGGSGFYLQAVLNGMYESESTSPELIKKSDLLYKKDGIKPFLEILKENDAESFNKYHENDHYRIRRAVEHFWMTGGKFSKSRDKMEDRKKNAPYIIHDWNILHIYLDIPKETHYDFIVQRTNTMFNDGLIEEVKILLENGASGEEKPLKSIGYKEVISLLNNEFKDENECRERISINTRKLAKAQRTWFNKLDKLSFNALSDSEKIIDACRVFIG